MNKLILESTKIIENNIHNKITIDFLAEQLGYSKFHFSRLFKEATGLTVHNYINNRKLICSAKDILSGKRIIDVAMNFGYDTHSGYTKAFIKKFGFPPNMLHAMRLIKELFSEIGGINMNYIELYTQLKTDLLKLYSLQELKLFEKAYAFALKAHDNQKRYSGEPYIVHPLSVAIILEKMDMPFSTIILGLLHETSSINSNLNKDDVINEFGNEYYENIQSIDKLNLKTDNINQLINELSHDIIIVKLADRLHNMKTLKHLSQTRWQEKATETMKLFLPLANAMEIEELKMELEHLSLEYL